VNRFSEAGFRPLLWYVEKARLIRRLSKGAKVRDIINGVDPHTQMLARLTPEETKILLDSKGRENERTINLLPSVGESVQYEGTIGDFSFWTHQDTYDDEDGNEIDMVPANETMLISPQVSGLRCYGAILDMDAIDELDSSDGLARVRRFPKMWRDKDPSTDLLMTQSAPLMVPRRINACGSWVGM
jgi:hypothetical protein